MFTPVYDFSWKGQSAFTNHGICVTEIGSESIAERRDTTHVVAGRSGLVHDQDGATEEIERSVMVYLPYEQGRTVSPVKSIRAWLRGYGALILPDAPGRFRMAYITDQIDFDPVLEGFADLTGKIIFRYAPYLYHSSAPSITLTQNSIVTNPGDADAAPIITVNASGDIDLMIGNQTILLTGLTGQIIINSEIEEAYVLNNGVRENMNNHMGGDFPILKASSATAISWSTGSGSTLSSIVIDPKWRDIN